jgi:hypothetical protein
MLKALLVAIQSESAMEELMSTAFRAILEGTQEVPPNDSTASGLGTVIFDSTEIAASYLFQVEGVDYGPAAGLPPQTPTPSTMLPTRIFTMRREAQTGSLSSGRSARLTTPTILLLRLMRMARGR